MIVKGVQNDEVMKDDSDDVVLDQNVLQNPLMLYEKGKKIIEEKKCKV
jgi:hypothetical protein